MTAQPGIYSATLAGGDFIVFWHPFCPDLDQIPNVDLSLSLLTGAQVACPSFLPIIAADDDRATPPQAAYQ